MPAAFSSSLFISGVAVAELTSIGGPGLSGDTIDLSNHQSTARARHFVAGMIDGGEVSMEGNLTASYVATLAAGNRLPCVLMFPVEDPADPHLHWTFYGYLTAFSSDAPYEGKASFSATVKISGLPYLGVLPQAMEAEATGTPIADEIAVTLSKEMDNTNLVHGDWSYSIDGGADQDFSAAALHAGDDRIVLLTPDGTNITVGDPVTVSYVPGTFASADGESLAALTDYPVVNNVT